MACLLTALGELKVLRTEVAGLKEAIDEFMGAARVTVVGA